MDTKLNQSSHLSEALPNMYEEALKTVVNRYLGQNARAQQEFLQMILRESLQSGNSDKIRESLNLYKNCGTSDEHVFRLIEQEITTLRALNVNVAELKTIFKSQTSKHLSTVYKAAKSEGVKVLIASVLTERSEIMPKLPYFASIKKQMQAYKEGFLSADDFFKIYQNHLLDPVNLEIEKASRTDPSVESFNWVEKEAILDEKRKNQEKLFSLYDNIKTLIELGDMTHRSPLGATNYLSIEQVNQIFKHSSEPEIDNLLTHPNNVRSDNKAFTSKLFEISSHPSSWVEWDGVQSIKLRHFLVKVEKIVNGSEEKRNQFWHRVERYGFNDVYRFFKVTPPANVDLSTQLAPEMILRFINDTVKDKQQDTHEVIAKLEQEVFKNSNQINFQTVKKNSNFKI